MAANLSGMLAQLSKAQGEGPFARATDQGIAGMATRPQDSVNPMINQAFQGLGGAFGADVSKMQTSNQAYTGAMDAMADLDLSTADGLKQAASMYQKIGMQPQALAMLEKAQAAEAAEVAARRTQMTREGQAKAYRKQGMDDTADRILSGDADLEETGKELRKLEVQDQLKKEDWPTTRAMLENSGLSTSQANSLRNASQETLEKYISGQEGKTKAFQLPNGETQMLRENKFGLVKHPQENRWVEPSSLNLQPAPNVQKIYNQADVWTEQLTKGAVDDFNALREDAREAVTTIERNDRSMQLLEAGINTGTGASLQTAYGKIAEAFGMDPAAAADANRTQAFLAERASQIGIEIKAFGSGTALSDKDAERAERIAVGEEAMSEDAMRFLLEQSTKTARRKVEMRNEVMAEIENGNFNSLDIMKIRDRDPAPQTTPVPSAAPEPTTRMKYNAVTGEME